MTRILLINPPSPYLENDAAYPPMGLLYLAAVLNGLGRHVEIADLAGGRPLPPTGGYDLAGITCVTPNVPQVESLIPQIDCPVMVGGPHPTFLPADMLARIRDGDCIVLGEAEPYEAYHIGNPEPVSAVDLARKVVRVFGSPSPIIEADVEPTIIPIKRMSFDRAKAVLGWEARIPLEEGLRRMREA